jgi:hypothetical protein
MLRTEQPLLSQEPRPGTAANVTETFMALLLLLSRNTAALDDGAATEASL